MFLFIIMRQNYRCAIKLVLRQCEDDIKREFQLYFNQFSTVLQKLYVSCNQT